MIVIKPIVILTPVIVTGIGILIEIDNLNARLPRHTPIVCDGFITLGLWLSVSIRSRLSSLTSHLRYVKPEMLSLGFRVIAHLWAGTAHHRTIENNVTPDPIFNFQAAAQVRRLFLSFNHNRLFKENKCEMKLKRFFALSFQKDYHFNMMCVIIVVTYLWRQNLCI